MNAAYLVKEMARLIEQNPEARIGHLSLTPHILSTAHEQTFCIKCGRAYKDGDTYCLECGNIRPNGSGKGY